MLIASYLGFLILQVLIDNIFNILVDDYGETELNEKFYTWLYNAFWDMNYIYITIVLGHMNFQTNQLVLRIQSSQKLLDTWIKKLKARGKDIFQTNIGALTIIRDITYQLRNWR